MPLQRNGMRDADARFATSHDASADGACAQEATSGCEAMRNIGAGALAFTCGGVRMPIEKDWKF